MWGRANGLELLISRSTFVVRDARYVSFPTYGGSPTGGKLVLREETQYRARI